MLNLFLIRKHLLWLNSSFIDIQINNEYSFAAVMNDYMQSTGLDFKFMKIHEFIFDRSEETSLKRNLKNLQFQQIRRIDENSGWYLFYGVVGHLSE